MIERAVRELRLDPKNSYVVGDQDGTWNLPRGSARREY